MSLLRINCSELSQCLPSKVVQLRSDHRLVLLFSPVVQEPFSLLFNVHWNPLVWLHVEPRFQLFSRKLCVCWETGVACSNKAYVFRFVSCETCFNFVNWRTKLQAHVLLYLCSVLEPRHEDLHDLVAGVVSFQVRQPLVFEFFWQTAYCTVQHWLWINVHFLAHCRIQTPFGITSEFPRNRVVLSKVRHELFSVAHSQSTQVF